VKISYDPRKNARNLAERGLSFELAEAFEWGSAVIWQDTRRDYGEERFHRPGSDWAASAFAGLHAPFENCSCH
jgi:hypothetical protein